MRQSNSQSREAQEGHWIYKRNPNNREKIKNPLQLRARGKLFGNDQCFDYVRRPRLLPRLRLLLPVIRGGLGRSPPILGLRRTIFLIFTFLIFFTT